MKKSWVAASPLGTFKVKVRKVGYGAEDVIAEGLLRRDASQLAGLLLMSPVYYCVSLEEEYRPGFWVDLPEQEGAG